MSLTAAALCLALTVYTEARGEPLAGQQAVALVTMNRAEWQPRNICKEIRKPGQFPWMAGPHQPIKEKLAWHGAQKVAQDVMSGRVEDFTGGATYFLGKGERPAWRRKTQYVMTIGGHRFYKCASKSPVTKDKK